jgi:alpha-L-fucosidase 2
MATANGPREVMQLDAGFGALQAVVELLVQQRGDVLHVLPALPRDWRDLSFDGIRCEGAFLIGATVRERAVIEVRVRAEVDGVLRIAVAGGEVVEREMAAGENLVL